MKIVIGIILMLVVNGCTSSIECEEVDSVESHKYEIDSLFTSIQPLLKKLNKKDVPEYKSEIYRVWYFHSLNKESYMVEYEKNVEGVIRFEKFEPDNGSKAMKVVERWEKTLSEKEWEHIKYLVDRYNFWKSEIIIKREVADGFIYLIEGNKSSCNKSISKIVLRASPDDEDEILWLCKDLFILGERLKGVKK